MHRTIFENDLQIAPILIGTDLHTNNGPRVTPGATRVEADRPLAFQGLALITLTQPSAIATAPTSYTCGVDPKYNLNGAFGVNVIPRIRARPAIDMSNAYRPLFASPRQYRFGQERVATRVDPAQVGGVEVHITPSKVRLPHAPHRRGEIIVHRTFSLELGLGAKHFGMSRAGQARSTRTSILYTEKIDLLAVYKRSPSLISSVPPFIR